MKHESATRLAFEVAWGKHNRSKAAWTGKHAASKRKVKDSTRPRAKRPTHFVSIRISSKDLVSQLAAVQEAILESARSQEHRMLMQKTRINARDFHVTLLVFGIDGGSDQRALDAAREALSRSVANMGPFVMEVGDLGTFSKGTVLYASVKSRALQNLAKNVEREFEHLLNSPFTFAPHVTLFKASKLKNGKKRRAKVKYSIPKSLGGIVFGRQEVGVVEISSMLAKGPDGYYLSVGSASLHRDTYKTILFGEKVYTGGGGPPLENTYIAVNHDGRICEISPSLNPRGYDVVRAPVIMPGCVDIHNHGIHGRPGEGLYKTWLNISENARALAKLGTTSCLASIIFADVDTNLRDVLEVCSTINAACENHEIGAARICGIHAEGPVIANLGGLPDSRQLSKMSLTEFESMLDNIGPYLRVMTISPSCDSGDERGFRRIKMLHDRGVRVSLGHDRTASIDVILQALLCGGSSNEHRSHLTHSFNVNSFHHRDCGLANFALTSKFPSTLQFEEVNREQILPPTTELIGDFHHVHPLCLQAVLASRDCGDVAFVSDAIAPPIPGFRVHYHGKDEAKVDESGSTLRAGATICGSCEPLFRTFQRMVRSLHVDIQDAVRMCCSTPAKIAKIDHDGVGELKVGGVGDMLVLSEDLELREIFVDGVVIPN